MKKKLLKVSIIGNTNAGKSTLINSIIGEKISITNKKINTTEDLTEGIINIAESQIIFYDTPGLTNIKKIESNKKKFKQNLWRGLDQSDLILYLIDIKKYNFDEIIKNIYKLKEINKKIIIVFNKNDLIKKNSILPIIKNLNKEINVDSYFSISAKRKLGLNNLKKYLLSKAYYSPWIYLDNEITNKDDKYFTNECTRNAILTYLHKEIPYNIKIINKYFKYLKNGDLKIKQDIEINNLRYKKIILGKKGAKIKEVRTKSQNEISKVLNVKVHLYINVIKSNAD